MSATARDVGRAAWSFLLLLLIAGSASAADPVYVDDDWIGIPDGTTVEPGKVIGTNAFDTIQEGVDAVDPAGKVFVAGGLYEEQVVIEGDLEVIGASADLTRIVAPSTLTEFFTTSADNYPVVLARNATTVVVRDVTVDGLRRGNANVRFMGIGFYNAGGQVRKCEVTGIRNNPLDGVQHGIAVFVWCDDGTSRTIAVRENMIDDFQKDGIFVGAAPGTALVGTIFQNIVDGVGPTPLIAQNGIDLFGPDLSGTVGVNNIDGIGYTDPSSTGFVASSVLDFGSDMNIVVNTITGAQMGIWKNNGNGIIGGNRVTVVKTGGWGFGIEASDPAAPRPQAAPYLETRAQAPPLGKASLMVEVTNNDVIFSGADNTNTWGILADAGFTADDLEFVATGNTVFGFNYGFSPYQWNFDTGVFTGINIHENNILNNTVGLESNVDYLTLEASCNWWGDITGPNDPPGNPGLGDAIVVDPGVNVVYWPWYDDEVDLGTCNQSGDNVSPMPDGDCISLENPCETVPVVFSRSDVTPARGVSVTIQLSSELELCDPVPENSILQGTWVAGSANPNTTFFIIDNGGGSYTVDQTIDGTPCDLTTGGELFTVAVQAVGGGDAVGTISVTEVLVRDCANMPLPGIPGPIAELTIDQTQPGAIASLTAAQRKTGNDSDGTTIIDVAWPAFSGADIDRVDIYRKGWGFYPEYDDNGGGPPTAQATPTDALSNGWMLAGSAAPGDGTFADSFSDRDFYYYTAFVIDDCGNASPVSNRTDGNLNYHLGDVKPGLGVGNNLVEVADVSALGASYGISLGPNDPVNWLDVGPTQDMSVNALPTTDNRVQFEDLILFAINYGAVSKAGEVPLPAARNRVTLHTTSNLQEDQIIEVPVEMTGDGTLQGLSVKLSWNRNVLQWEGIRPGDLLEAQGGTHLVLEAEAGVVDGAVFGTRSRGISGQGTLFVARLRVKGSGAHGLAISQIDGRSPENAPVHVDGAVVTTATPETTARKTTLHRNVPNPFNPRTTLSYTLGRDGLARVEILTLDGRRVRELVNEVKSAGTYDVEWNGTDDHGRRVASGAYVVVLSTPDRTLTRSIALLK